MTDLVLYDTASRRKRDFVPIDENRVTMYVCGPTVYAPAHVGNFRPEVVFDVLFRVLRHRYGAENVLFSRNFTDVDDKINAAALAEGVEIGVITERFTNIYHSDAAALNVLPKTFEPTATGTMEDIIAFIARLIDDGFAYAAEGHVLFSVSSYQDYGKLSRRSLDDMIAGARVEVAPYKKDPQDFVLWKPSKPGDPVWESPFGPGRPGWHIECSAMIEKSLGKTIDIHGGGIDLTFPHHENEIAQSTCAHGGAPLANYWLHNGFLSMGEEKMSKSEGNVVTVHAMLARNIRGEAIRYGLLSGQYRAPLDWNAALIERAEKSLDRLYGVLRRLDGIEAADIQPSESVMKALNDDLNTPKALAALFEIAGRANKADTLEAQAQAKGELLAAGELLGLFENDPDTWFGLSSIGQQQMEMLDSNLAQRTEAKAAKDFDQADEIRANLENNWISVQDTPEGPVARYNVDYYKAYSLLESALRAKASRDEEVVSRIPSRDGSERVVDGAIRREGGFEVYDSNIWSADRLAEIINLRSTEFDDTGQMIENYYFVLYGYIGDQSHLIHQLSLVDDARVRGVAIVRADGSMEVVERVTPHPT